MTINDLIASLSQYTWEIAIALFTIPVVTILLAKLISKPNRSSSPYKYMYSVLVYLTSLPGVFSIIVVAYTLFFLRGNILDLNLVVSIFPIVSMLITMAIIKRSVDLKFVPGFDKLRGLYLMLTVVFILALVIAKTRIFLLFGGSFMTFVIIIIVLIVMYKIGKKALFGGGNSNNLGPRP